MIQSAYYGCRKGVIDVTKTLLQVSAPMQVDGKLRLGTNINLNGLFGDPYPGIPKYLLLEWKENEKIRRICLPAFGGYLTTPFDSSFNVVLYPTIPSSNVPDYRGVFQSLRGIEVGGPTDLFASMNLYNGECRLDCINPLQETVWSKQLEGSPFKSKAGVELGVNFIKEATNLQGIPDGKYDFIAASHVLEHIANPLLALKEWKRITKPGARFLLVLPWKDATFDHRRPITLFDDLLHHLQNNTDEHDLSHLNEILTLHDLTMDLPAGTLAQFTERSKHNFQNRCLHHHVFDFHLIEQCLRFFDIVTVDVHLVQPFHQIVLGFRKDKM